ncbi:ubiquitin-related domain-containing protein [Gilbertella persicaria]|uniref:ubiquitin-related domain-containing protein n=1 Tax=Gilbertella persicaria TaxID=101096 RepID=UPI00221EAA94|nr:ubiquitin-related domain-containing protein [Gilbertella persicaria]KAI8059055.1 ubiquitin-related domain-containing protein [Gilbertella persicaria]
MQSAQTELDFINLYLEALSSKSVRYGQDYTTHTWPTQRIKKVPPTPVILEKAPVAPVSQSVDGNKLEVTVKVLKPSSQFTIGGLSPNNTVAQLKQRIYQQQSSLPVNRQRLLIKGKALPDQKTLNELSIQENAVVHLMVTAAPAPSTGRFGVSAEAEQKMSSPEFWSALEKTVIEQLGETDAKLVFSKIKGSLQ